MGTIENFRSYRVPHPPRFKIQASQRKSGLINYPVLTVFIAKSAINLPLCASISLRSPDTFHYFAKELELSLSSTYTHSPQAGRSNYAEVFVCKSFVPGVPRMDRFAKGEYGGGTILMPCFFSLGQPPDKQGSSICRTYSLPKNVRSFFSQVTAMDQVNDSFY